MRKVGSKGAPSAKRLGNLPKMQHLSEVIYANGKRKEIPYTKKGKMAAKKAKKKI
jgi:hypothetical protein